MADPEPTIEGSMPKVDDIPLSSLGHSDLGLLIEAHDRAVGVGVDDALAIAAFNNYLSD